MQFFSTPFPTPTLGAVAFAQGFISQNSWDTVLLAGHMAKTWSYVLGLSLLEGCTTQVPDTTTATDHLDRQDENGAEILPHF